MASHQHTGPSQVPPPRTKQVPQSPQRQTAEEIRSQVEQNSTREPNPFSVFREAQDKEAKQPATKKALSLNNILTRPDHQWRVIAVEPTVHQSQAEHNSTREPNPFRAVAGRIISLIPAQPPSSSNRWKSTEDDAASSFSPSKARTPTSPPPDREQRREAMRLIEHALCHVQPGARVFLEEDVPEIVVYNLPSGTSPSMVFKQNPELTRGPRIGSYLGNTRTLRLTLGWKTQAKTESDWVIPQSVLGYGRQPAC